MTRSWHAPRRVREALRPREPGVSPVSSQPSRVRSYVGRSHADTSPSYSGFLALVCTLSLTPTTSTPCDQWRCCPPFSTRECAQRSVSQEYVLISIHSIMSSQRTNVSSPDGEQASILADARAPGQATSDARLSCHSTSTEDLEVTYITVSTCSNATPPSGNSAQ